jgi:hypothetical protein
MGAKVERIERYLRGVAVPSYASERHRQQLRRRILGEIGKKRTISVPGRIWKVAVAGILLVCLGGAVGTLIDMRYHIADRQADGVGQLVAKDAREAYTPGSPVADANGAREMVQTAKEPEKADLPPEPDDIEVVMVGANAHSPAQVIEVKASGRPGTTPLQYAVAKGRRNVVETSNHSPLSTSLSPADWVELSQLRQAGKGEDLGTQERQLNGRAFVFNRERYTLRNGAKVVVSVGMPKDTK